MAHQVEDPIQRKIARLKRYEKSENLIKSPYYNDPKLNPCIKEQNASVKCGIENSYDTKACKSHYDNYKICMRFWNWIEWERKYAGIEPFLPPPEERPQIMAERMREIRNAETFKGALYRIIFNT